MRKLTVSALLALFLGAVSAPAQAATITFDQLFDSGTLSYDGAGGALIGASINMDVITGVDVPNPGVLQCVNCKLDFETGANVSEPLLGAGVWTFAAGGTFVIEGDAFDPITATTVASGVLLSGSFSSNPVLPFVAGGGSFLSAIGFGVDTKDADLLAFFGLGPNTPFRFANAELSATAAIDPVTNSFTAAVDEADVINSVPEPASMLLLGTGLFGFVAAARRRRARV